MKCTTPKLYEMKCKYLIVLLLLLILSIGKPTYLFAQEDPRSLEEVFDMYVSYGFKTQYQWDTIRGNLHDQNKESVRYANLLEEKSHEYLLYPFWMGNEYAQLEGLEAKVETKRLGYFAYVLSPKVGLFNTTYSWSVKNAVDSDLFKDTPVDLVLYCRGRAESELFLQSDSAQLNCIQDFYFKLSRSKEHPELRKANGVNIYFPDFPFSMIEEYKEFIQRFSIYNQMFGKLHNHKYELYLTLPKICNKISSQLLETQKYVDGIYFADYNEYGISQQKANLQSQSLIEPMDFNEAYDRYQAYHYRSPKLWKYIREQYDNPENELAYYQNHVADTTKPYMIYPYWLGDLYRDMPMGSYDSISRMAYMAYVIDPLTGNTLLKNSWADRNIFDEEDVKSIPKDLLVYCRGEIATDVFLDSDSSRMHCIKNIFSMCMRSDDSSDKDLVNPNGINIYFPDFSFRKKREFAQFIKSISIVKDSLMNKDSIRFCEKLDIRLSFPKYREDEKPYLASVLNYVDSIYFVDFDQFGLPISNCKILTKANNKIGIIQEIRNQFYLYRFKPLFNLQVNNTSVESIIKIGIDKNDWEKYFVVIVFLFMILLFIPVAYITNCCLHELLNKNIIVSFLVVLMLIMELIFLSVFMIEEMSSEIVFFDCSGSTQFVLLLLPIVVTGIYPALKSLQRQGDLP